MSRHKKTYQCSECGEGYEDEPLGTGPNPHPRTRCELRLRRIIERLDQELAARRRSYERICQEVVGRVTGERCEARVTDAIRCAKTVGHLGDHYCGPDDVEEEESDGV